MYLKENALEKITSVPKGKKGQNKVKKKLVKKTSVPKRKLLNLEKFPKTEEKSSVPKRKSFKKKQNLFVQDHFNLFTSKDLFRSKSQRFWTNLSFWMKKNLVLNKENLTFKKKYLKQKKKLLYLKTTVKKTSVPKRKTF